MNGPEDILKVLDAAARKNLGKWKLSESKSIMNTLTALSHQQTVIIKQQAELASQQAHVIAALDGLVKELKKP